MLVAAAVCPHPPALVPELAAGAAPELDDLRAACRRAVEALLGAEPDVLVVVGGGMDTRACPPGSTGSFRPYGVGVEVTLGSGEVAAHEPPLPLSVAVGAWLLRGTVTATAVRGQVVASDAPPERCRELGQALAGSADRVALLVMGDGSARRSPLAPGYADPRAEPFDAAVVRALADGDAPALLDLDPGVDEELMVAGRAAWQVLAGAAGDAVPDASVLHHSAPYGVGYVVAVWSHHG